MNSVIEAILTRRSVRAFSDKPISNEDLSLIAKCAVYAPCARNRQLWNFAVVNDRDTIAKLAKATAAAIGADPSYNFYAPNALIIASAPRDSRFGTEDCSCALQNIFLAAHSLSIGSVWINQLCDCYDDPDVRAVLSEAGVPADNAVHGMAALGYPSSPVSQMTKDESNIVFKK
ncbi:MAG: nitroreductase family protein [Clostridia bacterium]|nr:nitroreductase family protein [Clostridia bacterium]